MCKQLDRVVTVRDLEPLREQIAELSEFAQATVPRVEAAATQVDLEALADRTARGLAHLAVAITELRRPTLRERIVAWFRKHVYDGTPVFTQTEFDRLRWAYGAGPNPDLSSYREYDL